MMRSSYSRASDTSSAYSGSDIMQSSANGDDGLIVQQSDQGLELNETDDESEASSEVSAHRRTLRRHRSSLLQAFVSHT